MKAIKVSAPNSAAIEAALHQSNGRADTHTYTDFAEIADLAATAERELLRIVGAKKDLPGAIFVSTSGTAVANAYKYSRQATRVTLERRATGWFLTDVEATQIYSDGGRERLSLTAAQREAAIARFCAQFTVIQPAQ